MMSKAEVKKIVEESIRPLRAALQLHDWQFVLVYDTSLGKDRAACTRDCQRHAATLTFNPAELEDEQDVLWTLLHELLHIYHAEFDLYLDSVKVPVPKQVFDAIEPSFHNACEHVVQKLERLLMLTFKTSPKKLIAAVRRREN